MNTCLVQKSETIMGKWSLYTEVASTNHFQNYAWWWMNKQNLKQVFTPYGTNEKPSLAEQIQQIKLYHSYPLLRVRWPDYTSKYDQR